MQKFLLFTLLSVFCVNNLAQYQLMDAFPDLPGFSSPVDLQNAGDCSNRIFVVERSGIIKVFENNYNANSFKIFLDITDSVTSGNELGLLGLAFHPDYENNGYFYVNYTASEPRRSVISRFSVSSQNPDSADRNSELTLLTQIQPFANHNGGQIAFGPDGYLYIALGDGGSGGDPQNHAQTLTDLLGKILRIDVDNPDAGLNYGIPPDNPLADSVTSVRKEIFAWGLRNPWRFSFDFTSGWLWCGDVGQGEWEEIDIIEKGKNYGWRCYEGNHAYNATGCSDISDYTFPVYEYPHDPECSVTGGYVYRGPNQPGLLGKYIYADYCSGKIWALGYDGNNPPQNQLIAGSPSSPTSFGVDEANELYICTFGGGRIYKFVPTAAIVAPSSLNGTVESPGTIILRWIDNSDNEEGFRIERKDGSSDFTEIVIVNAGITSYQDLVTQIQDYRYRVTAYNSADTSGFSNEICIPAAIVPVELGLFKIEISKTESSVILKWETVSEKNNHGFEIQRDIISPSGDGADNFVTIGFVEGNGTTTEKSYYQYIDNFAGYGFNGTLVYRLKQVDFDGSFSYSGKVAVDLTTLRKDYTLFQNYPNPFNPATKIGFNIPEECKIKIEIINSLGQTLSELVNDVRKSGLYYEDWSANNFSSGVYYVRMEARSLVSGKIFQKTIKTLYLK